MISLHVFLWIGCMGLALVGFCALVSFAAAGNAATQPTPHPPRPRKLDVAAIYFPSWHADDHYSSWYGENWNEWKLLQDNPLRFPGQNRVKPSKDWGYFDEADPKMMARQIDLATSHGIDVFIFDWYWYNGVQILQRPVEETLPKTPNRDKIKYALMWANHNWLNYFPYPYDSPTTRLLPIRHSAADFDRVMEHCIKHHFNQSNYWRVDGAVYFSLFGPEYFVNQLGGAEKARAVLEAARKKVRDAGLGDVHFAAFTGNPQSIPMLKEAGFESITSYNMTMTPSTLRLPEHPFVGYGSTIHRPEDDWNNMDSGVLPYAPVVTVGWDVTPRWELNVPWPPEKNFYPYTPVVIDNTPEKFGDFVRQALRQIDTSKLPAPFLLINSWNEWTEGSPLLPQEKYGDGYLRELKKVLDEYQAGDPAATPAD